MKVIVAGYSKTGTKSMNAALTQLGYNVYDSVENMVLLQDEYGRIFHEGWSTEDFRRMYEHVDAVTDIPACYFWDEIHKAFPDAKIILTIRENEDEWWKSLVNQIEASRHWPNRLVECLSPTIRGMKKKILNIGGVVIFGFPLPSPLAWKLRFNEQMAKKCYRSHNAYVMQTAPKDKLLVYKCTEGWEPLCKFLGVPVPDTPFPRKNVRGNIYNEMDQNPIYQQIQREVKMALFKWAVVAGVVTFCSIKYGPVNSVQAVCNHAKSFFERIWPW